jgi:Putative adhesin
MRFLIFSTLMMSCAGVLANECAFEEPRNLDIDAAGLHTLEAKLGSSDLRAEGVAGLSKIEVRARACSSDKSRLSGLTVDQTRVGDTVTVTTHQADEQTFNNMTHSNYAYIDLVVRIPQSLALRVRSNSGDGDVKNLSSLDFSSHSGDLIVNHVDGAVIVDVHSGDVKANGLGSLDVQHSGSGDIQAAEVKGDVHVGRVGSGDLTFSGIGKGVHIESVGSGDVIVRGAGGTVLVDSIGSGDVNASDIGGDLIVKSAGSGDVHHSSVKGKVSVPKNHDDE